MNLNRSRFVKGLATWAVSAVLAVGALGAKASSIVPLPVWPRAQTMPAEPLVVLTYHAVRNAADTEKDTDAISRDTLITQWEWLRGHDWHFVSWAQVAAARHGGPALPERAVLVTFDDGLKSAYTQVFPLAKAYQVPVVMALVDRWIDLPKGQTMDYNGRTCTADCFVSWDEVRAMDASGMVTIISHSDHLHQGITANPQGNLLPAAMNAAYDPATHQYETPVQYRQRISHDLSQSAATLRKHLGHAVPAIAWPYGAYNGTQVEVAEAQGWVSLGLSASGPVQATDRVLERILVGNDMKLDDFVRSLGVSATPQPVRAVVLSFNDLSAPTQEARDARLGQLLDRLKTLHPTEVWLQDWQGQDAQGHPYSWGPVQEGVAGGDVWSRTVWQLRTRAAVQVYAVVPQAQASVPFVHAIARIAALDGIVIRGTPGVDQQQVLYTALRDWRPAGKFRVWSDHPMPLLAKARSVCTVSSASAADCTNPESIRIWVDAGGPPQPQILQDLLAQGHNRLGFVWHDPLAAGEAWRQWYRGISYADVPFEVPAR